ncbi:MAG: hypothetical protein BGO25_19845 [Acidobacteriales bacterium 59-55]|nr:hypothetical protein [Terriglobales bacterium]OJV41883.1 MAG: hypothetical protein BGO25_19845 [Acidobacteriales bacterium 59-55]
MTTIGASEEWADLIDSMVPQILELVIASWQQMTSPVADEKEDDITIALWRILTQNRTARHLMFQIRLQVVELDPMPGEDFGRMDIAFIPPVPSEDIYFCLESKRLNAIKSGKTRTYASEYVRLGMLRFITGRYSKAVQHGGMLGYVLDAKVPEAINSVEENIKQRHKELCMASPGVFQLSSVVPADDRARETHHQRAHQKSCFHIHHLFMPSAPVSATTSMVRSANRKRKKKRSVPVGPKP